MFIKRKEWEDKCDSNRALIKNNEEKEQKIRELKFQLENAEKHNIQLIEEIKSKENIEKIQKERISDLNNDNDILMKANQRLTDWINKIINEVGIYEVQDRRTITIPICKNPVKAAFGNIEDIRANMGEFMSQEEIIIPEIRFVRMK